MIQLVVMGVLAWLLIGVGVGCQYVGFAAYVFGGGEKTAIMPADYRGLDHQSVAVLVSADEYVQYEYPAAVVGVCSQVSRQLVQTIPQVKVLPPQQVHGFQNTHAYWNTLPHDQLLSELEVDRLILVDLIRYATHEPGNPYVRRGAMTAHISVVEAQSPNPNLSPNPNHVAYASTVEAYFPPAERFGRVETNDTVVTLGLHRVFAEKVANLFHDHEVTVP